MLSDPASYLILALPLGILYLVLRVGYILLCWPPPQDRDDNDAP